MTRTDGSGPRPVRVVALVLTALVILVFGRPADAHADLLSDATAAIDVYSSQPEQAELLGAATQGVRAVRGGAAQTFTNGEVYFSPRTGAHAVLGAIAIRYRAVGGPATIGFPIADEQAAGDGRYSQFGWPGGAHIYWSPATRASLLTGGVLRAWLASGGVGGPFGFPVTDTTFTGMDDESTFAGPEGTKISWSSTRGLATVPAGLAAANPAMAEAAAASTLPSAEPESEVPAAGDESDWGHWWPWLLAALVLLLLLGVFSALARRRRPETVTVTSPAGLSAAADEPAAGLARVAAPAGEAGESDDAESDAEETAAEETVGAPMVVYDPLSEETAAASSAVLTYESPETAGIVVEYENNAVGAESDSHADETIAQLRDGGDAVSADAVSDDEVSDDGK